MIDGDGVATGENHVTFSEGNDELSENSDYANEKCTPADEECTVTHNLHGFTNPGDEDATSDMLAKFEKAYFKKFHETIMEDLRIQVMKTPLRICSRSLKKLTLRSSMKQLWRILHFLQKRDSLNVFILIIA
ncbi:hypothetical protein MKW92_047091 [Papaver armeniacum]|nr:hypothetical protein MKW92_047091 [Papaver armeniacum]